MLILEKTAQKLVYVALKYRSDCKTLATVFHAVVMLILNFKIIQIEMENPWW